MAKQNEPQLEPHAASQKQRWVKYGANVALAIVVAAALTFFVIALAQRATMHVDTTSSRVYSLKPQTTNVVKDLKQKVRIVSLYSAQTKPDARTDPEGRITKEEWPNYVQTVSDLLAEYKRAGSNVEVELIDPANSPTKVDQLITEVSSKYGGEVKKYQEYVKAFPDKFIQIKKLADAEAAAIEKLPTQGIANEDLADALSLSVITVSGFPQLLDRNEEAIQKLLKQKPPDYKGATSRVEQSTDTLSAMLGQILGSFDKLKADPGVPQAIKQYMDDSTPRYQQMKTLADDLVKSAKDLGELKLDDLRQSLRQQNTILVLGEKDLKVIPFNKVWQEPADLRQYVGDAAVKPRFAGEQQVTAAIVALSQEKKPRVVIVRPDGAPVASQGMPPFQQGGPMSAVAARLSDLNFEVLEKDLSGMYAMQASMRGMPGGEDATEEQMKGAVWVVLAYPSSQQQNPMQMQQPPNQMTEKLKAHLDEGGAAVVLVAPAIGGTAPQLDPALKPRGIEPKPTAIIVHEALPDEGGTADQLDQARRLPFVFNMNNYGDQLLTKPLRSLDSLLVPLIPVDTVTPEKGYTTTPILPVPAGVKVWGETDIESLSSGKQVTFDAATDMASPKFAGATASGGKGERLVVLGSPVFMWNRYLEIPDPNLARRGTYVSRFPGNAELFINSVLWAAGQDALLAISPSAMEVSRLRDMSDRELMTSRLVIMAGIPLAVVLLGAFMWMKRRD